MSKPIPEHLHFNNKWILSNDLIPKTFSTGTTLYEVIRIIEGLPLFIEEHLDRLELSANLINFKIWLTSKEIKQIIDALIKKNSINFGNIKISMNRSSGSNHKNFACQNIPSHYPSKSDYLDGVSSTLFNAERKNPKVKRADQSLRNETDIVIKSKKVFEVVLVDDNNLISEGSRSNIFFIKDQTIYTSVNDRVLAGITRQKIIHLCEINNIKIVEKNIKSDDLSQFDSAFFTGTSPKVLPINCINLIKFNPKNPLLKKLMYLYNDEINRYIQLAKIEIKK